MLLHSGWNSMGRDFLGRYVMVQVPIFLLAVLVIVLLRVAERRLTASGSGIRGRGLVYRGRGRNAVATAAGRRSALRWARSTGRACR